MEARRNGQFEGDNLHLLYNVGCLGKQIERGYLELQSWDQV